MSMFGPKLGTWWVSSKIDPRWDKTGRGYGLVSTGGPDDMMTWIAHCEKEFGNPPEDAEMGFMKD